MTEDKPARVRCRPIVADDIASLVPLLSRGFPNRSPECWSRALQTLAMREAPEAYPRFGYLLEQDRTPVGVILTIFSRCAEGGVRCNISSWYSEPSIRGFASLLIAAALRDRSVTYINISPAPHTWPVIEAQGFRRYCNGQMLTIPTLNRSHRAATVERFSADADYGEALSEFERLTMTDHVARGCIGLLVREDTAAYPFLLLPRRILKDRLPVLQLVYCRAQQDFVEFAGPIGRWLLARGHLLVLVDALEHIGGLRGIFFQDRGPKYTRGPLPPHLGDLTYCENILFGG